MPLDPTPDPRRALPLSGRGLRLCETCGPQLDTVMEKINAEAERLEAEAESMFDLNVTWGRRAGSASSLRWAAALLMEAPQRCSMGHLVIDGECQHEPF